MGIFWELDENKTNLMGTIWELDGKSSPNPFKKIRNIPWEHVCATQLAYPFKKIRDIGAPHMLYPSLFFLGTSY
jgi:hypothetical protein